MSVFQRSFRSILGLCLIAIFSLSVGCGDEVRFHGAEGQRGSLPQRIDSGDVVREQPDVEDNINLPQPIDEEEIVQPVITDPKEETPPPPPGPDPITETSIVFGDTTSYHIGDDDYGTTSCMSEIASTGFSGEKYSFYFEVVHPDTTVEISIARMCGVDLNTSNYVAIMQGEVEIYKVFLKKDQTKLTIPAQVLTTGEARLVLESMLNSTETSPPNHDDFLFGGIKIIGSRLIHPGEIVVE